jgi:hypothetical protein
MASGQELVLFDAVHGLDIALVSMSGWQNTQILIFPEAVAKLLLNSPPLSVRQTKSCTETAERSKRCFEIASRAVMATRFCAPPDSSPLGVAADPKSKQKSNSFLRFSLKDFNLARGI